MAETTKIEWCDATFNPWIGCQRVSPGCEHCYAEARDRRYTGGARWGPKGERHRTAAAYWKQPLAWNRAAQREGKRLRVFCASLADVFEGEEFLDSWREDLWTLIAQCPHLDWLLLTKRPERVIDMVPGGWVGGLGWPPNVWIGTTAEDQRRANERIPELCRIPAPVRFVSCEPLLGPVQFDMTPSGAVLEADEGCGDCGDPGCDLCGGYYRLNWVITGGESGRHARPMHPDWARSLRDQCQAAGVPFFFKQWGEWAPMPEGWDLARWPKDATAAWPDGSIGSGSMRENGGLGIHLARVGKKVAGRLLDGREWNESPEQMPEARP